MGDEPIESSFHVHSLEQLSYMAVWRTVTMWLHAHHQCEQCVPPEQTCSSLDMFRRLLQQLLAPVYRQKLLESLCSLFPIRALMLLMDSSTTEVCLESPSSVQLLNTLQLVANRSDNKLRRFATQVEFSSSVFEFQLDILRRKMIDITPAAFTQIRTLIVKSLASDELLACIGKSCYCLEHLEVSSTTRNVLTSEGIRLLCGLQRQDDEDDVAAVIISPHRCCHSIKVFGILWDSVYQLSGNDAVFLLKHLASITEFTAATCALLADIVTILRKTPDIGGNLISVSDSKTAWDSLVAISTRCPKIETLRLVEPQPGVVRELNVLFPRLQNLSLTWLSFSELEVYLRGYGFRLSSLDISACQDTVNLSSIVNFCPSLSHLSIWEIDLRVTDNCKCFSPLRKLSIRSCTVSNDDLFRFLKYVPHLQHLSAFPFPLDDTAVAKLIKCGALQSLESLHISTDILTLASACILLKACSLLHKFGYISEWKIISNRKEHDSLLTFVKNNALATEIC